MPSTLIRTMLEKHGYPVVNEKELDAFLESHREAVLFFAENPKQFPESDDVAMILPELVKAFGGRFQPALVARESERTLQGRFAFTTWPTLVFLREGQYLGAISGVQNWEDYLQQIEGLLASEPSPMSGLGIPVVSESPATCH